MPWYAVCMVKAMDEKESSVIYEATAEAFSQCSFISYLLTNILLKSYENEDACRHEIMFDVSI